MGKLKGFLEYRRVDPPYRPRDERIRDYREVTTRLSEEALMQQAARCMDCGVPFCHALGCPLGNVIPEWNDLLYLGRVDEAYERLALTNNFPEITGRICPAPCEAACTLSINDSPVTIRQIEFAISEAAFARNLVRPQFASTPSGKRVAVVGSGPAGLAAAQQLARYGHDVVVMEKAHQPGGLLRYGIPNFKLEKWVLDRRIAQMTDEGVRFETNVQVGEDISARFLCRTFDAVVLACGAEVPRDLVVPGRELSGIHYAMDFLAHSNRVLQGEIVANADLNAAGKIVLVIGGGDTGADCVGTAIRQGARQITQIEILPMPRQWNKSENPDWPYWPNILRTSSSHQEGCERLWSITTKKFEGNNGKVTGARVARVTWQHTAGTRSFQEVPESEFTIPADLIIIAAGFTGITRGKLIQDLGVETTASGTIAVDATYKTSVPGIFAAGDAVLGPSLVVRAIAQGRETAQALHTFLRSGNSLKANCQR